MDDIYAWTGRRSEGNVVYESEAIKLPERLTVLYGLSREVRIITEEQFEGLYLNRIECWTLPGAHFDLRNKIPGLVLNYNTRESAQKGALKLEKRLKKFIQKEEDEEYTISAVSNGASIYYIHTEKVGDHFTLVAREVESRGELDARLSGGISKELFPITFMEDRGYQKLFYPYGGPAGFLRYSINDVSPLIQQVEKEMLMRYLFRQNEVIVNAFSIGNWTGYRKGGGDYFETPIRFYKVDVDTENDLAKRVSSQP